MIRTKLNGFEWFLLGIVICLFVLALCFTKPHKASATNTADINNVLGPYPSANIPDVSANIEIFDYVDHLDDYVLQFTSTGKELMIAYNQSSVTREFELLSQPNEYRRSGNVLYSLGPYEWSTYFFGASNGWVPSGSNIISVSANTNLIKFSIIKLGY